LARESEERRCPLTGPFTFKVRGRTEPTVRPRLYSRSLPYLIPSAWLASVCGLQCSSHTSLRPDKIRFRYSLIAPRAPPVTAQALPLISLPLTRGLLFDHFYAALSTHLDNVRRTNFPRTVARPIQGLHLSRFLEFISPRHPDLHPLLCL
jgi:hypothetical protein